jgi:hypothetical protein
MSIDYIKNSAYSPWRYRKMAEPSSPLEEPLDDIKLSRPDDRL